MRSFVICTPHPKLFGRINHRCLAHMGVEIYRNIYRSWWGNMKKRDQLKNIKMDLEKIG
jgi:hypothetical protein